MQWLALFVLSGGLLPFICGRSASEHVVRVCTMTHAFGSSY